MKDAFNPNSFFLLSLLVQGATLSILRFIAQKNRHLLKRGSADFQVGREVTGRVNPAIVSFLAGCQSRERLRLIDAHSPLVQAHILARPNKTLEFSISDMTVLSTKTGGSCWQVSVKSVRLLSSCLLIQLMKRKRVRRKLEMNPLGNEVD